MSKFELWRQDDNGNRFLISSFAYLDEAEAKLGEFESKGHKQHYWLSLSEQNNGVTDQERIRLRPGMYIGSTDSSGGEHVLCEVVANSVDQFLQGFATCIEVKLCGASFEVKDNGTGFNRGHAGLYLERFHDSATADEHAPHIHMSPRGLGLCAVNALSSSLFVESFDDSGRWRLDYSRGELQQEQDPTSSSGTVICGELDVRVFGESTPNPHRIRRILFDAAHLFPGLKISFNQECFYAPDGLVALAEFEAFQRELSVPSGDTWKRFGFQTDGAELGLNFACYGESQMGSSPSVISWVNGRLTPGEGSHVEGAMEALSRQGWIPSTVLIHVWMKEPEYAGPTMDKLRAPKIVGVVRELLSPPLEQFLDSMKNESSSL